MANDAAAVEEVHLPLPPPLQGALAAGPYNFQFTGEDFLRLTVVNSLTGVRVQVAFRTAPTTTTTQTNAAALTPTTDRIATTLEFSVGTGYLLNVTVFASGGNPKEGQTFVKLQVIRGMGANAMVLGTIVQGYVTAAQDLGWPGSPIQSSLAGPGYARLVTGTTPAAGNSVSELVPAGARWRLVNLRVSLVNDANVGNRLPYLQFVLAATVQVISPMRKSLPALANVSLRWTNAMQLDGVVAADELTAGLPTDFLLMAGDNVRVFLNGGFAGDQLSLPHLWVQEWLEVN